MTDWGGKVAAYAVGVTLGGTALATLIVTEMDPLHGWWLGAVILLGVLAAVSFLALLPIGLAAWKDWRRSRHAAGATEEAYTLPPPDPAEWVAGCTETDNHTLTFTLQHKPKDPATTSAIGEKRCTVTDPDGTSTTAAGRASEHRYGPLSFPGAPPVQTGTYRFTWQGQDAAGTWHELTSGTYETQLPALIVRITEGPVWEAWQHFALIVAYHIEITNTTRIPIQIVSTGHGGIWPTEYVPTDEENLGLARELRRRRDHDHYGPPPRLRAPLPGRTSASGWEVTSINRGPHSGTPEITVAATDATGARYTCVIPAQPGNDGPRVGLTSPGPAAESEADLPDGQAGSQAQGQERHDHKDTDRTVKQDDEARQVLVQVTTEEHPGTGHNFNRRVTLSTPHTYPIKQVEGCLAIPSNYGGLGITGFGHGGDEPYIDEKRIYYRFWAAVPVVAPGAKPIMRFVDRHGNRYYQYQHHTQRFPQNTDWTNAAQAIDQWLRTGPKPD